MTFPSDDWPRVKEVFAGARALPADLRAAYLAEACDGDEVLLQEVESLLASDARAKSFLETPAVPLADITAARNLEGQHIGPYQLAAKIGVGGMGEVYRACDTKLNRQVAIKVLLPAVANDPDRLARFSREAQVLASLNHPHIAQIHGLEDAPSTDPGHARILALVMELVEGPTLADRIARGAIPIDEALAIARQIAEALEAAHEQGIVHRDLKPANIKVREDGTVKVLDFGLAKALDQASGSDVAAMTSPTLSVHATDAGVILGTAAYMSPEQARGKVVDRRTDLWAFGCVLYEMLTERRAFEGDTLTDVLAAVVKHEPNWTRLPAETPLPIRTLLRRCLEKDRKRRVESAADARLEIDDGLAAPAVEMPVPKAVETLARPVAPSRRVALTAAMLAGVALVTAIVAWILMRPAPQAPVLSSRFAIVTPPAQPLNVSSNDRDLALSPDGRYLVYRFGGGTTAGSPLMVRTIDQLDARPIADVRGAYAPFVSSDSRWIGFVENAAIKKVSIAGGAVITLAPLAGETRGASWGDDNTIVFATDDPTTGLRRVSADGGEPTLLTKPDVAQHEEDHLFPSVLPGGRGVLFTITAGGRADSAQVAVLDLKTGQRKTLVRGATQAEYVAPSAGSGQAGYLVYAVADSLRAVRFDPVRLEVLSDPVTVVERMMTKPSGAANYAASRLGTIVHVPDGAVEPTPISSLVWVSRNGIETPIAAPPRAYGPPRLSPDGRHVAVAFSDRGNTDVWILDLAQETLRRLTFSSGMDGLPLWTPDGRRIIFMSVRSGALNGYSQAADGTGTVERLTTSKHSQWPISITPDAATLFGFERRPPEMLDVVVAHSTTPKRPGASASPAEPPARALFDGAFPEISPDGRYLAYKSDESGRDEVYVRPFPQVDGGRWQISTTGGTRAAWARSGRELFYINASMALIRVPVRTTGSRTFTMGAPAKVFDATYAEPNPSRHYDVSPDGQRFLMLKESVADPNATPASMVVVQNWFEELHTRVR